MTTRRRFSSDFKAKVALEALRGDRTIPEMASRHKVHPNQVSAWKRQAMDGLGSVFSNGADKAHADHEGDTPVCPENSASPRPIRTRHFDGLESGSRGACVAEGQTRPRCSHAARPREAANFLSTLAA